MKTLIGIDVSKAKLDCLWLKEPDGSKVKTKKTANNQKGYSELLIWLKTTESRIDNLHIIIEATGCYHQRLAHFLFDNGINISVINPSRAKAFSISLGVTHKTDKQDSLLLALYGLHHKPKFWQPEPIEVRDLKSMLGRLEALEKDLRRESNRLEKAEIALSPDIIIESLCNMLKVLKQEKLGLENNINDHINKHPRLKKDRELMESIIAVGPVTSRTLLAVIHSKNFKNASQLSAYLGLIPVQCESGIFKGKSHLSKKGPSNVRAKLYMTTVAAVKYNPDIRAQYNRLLNNGKTKMQALCAAMRKLVQICFGVVKNQSKYRPLAV